MNFEKNTKDWNVGDIVIHDSDSKKIQMLMRVVDVTGLHKRKIYKTEYINEDTKKQTKMFHSRKFSNYKDVLHDPTEFYLDITQIKENGDRK